MKKKNNIDKRKILAHLLAYILTLIVKVGNNTKYNQTLYIIFSVVIEVKKPTPLKLEGEWLKFGGSSKGEP